MTYRVEWSQQATAQLRKLDRQVGRRLLAKITKLAADPTPRGCRPLQGQPAGTYRIRIGDYRVIYAIDGAELVVLVVRVAHRSEVPRTVRFTVPRPRSTAPARGS